jgi:hypothetical protein
LNEEGSTAEEASEASTVPHTPARRERRNRTAPYVRTGLRASNFTAILAERALDYHNPLH